MSDSDRQAISRFGLLWPVAALVITIAAITTSDDAPLLSSRPESSASLAAPDPPAASGIRSTHAQLWEDPLESARRARSDKQKLVLGSPLEVQTTLKNILKDRESQFLIMPVLIPGGPYAMDREERMKTRYAVLSALGTSGFKLAYAQRMSATTIPIVADMGATRMLDISNVEVPIKLFRKEGPSDGAGVAGTTGDAQPNPRAIQFVLVLWINETQLGQKPLEGLAQVLEQLFRVSNWDNDTDCEEPGKKDVPKLAVIGPSQSGSLLSMLKEDTQWLTPDTELIPRTVNPGSEAVVREGADHLASWFTPTQDSQKPAEDWLRRFRDADIFRRSSDPAMFVRAARHLASWFAATQDSTPVEDWLGRLRKADIFRRFSDPTMFSPRATVSFEELELTRAAYFENCGIKLVHGIGTDLQLFDVLARELKIRGCLPESSESDQHIVIVTERDTLYGRSIYKTFLKVLDVSAEQNVHLFTYLRGIDGQVSSASEQPSSSGADATQIAELELPEGTSQRDYLRRMANEVVHLDAGLRLHREGKVSAICVVGSDVFDKLLVLRALRNRFPTARFFTTDLDARYSTPMEYDYTRNLIVVSHFGLGLNRSLRYDVPPFRDSYQTSTFFTALRAVDSSPLHFSLEGKAADNPWGRGVQRHRNTIIKPPGGDALSPLNEERGFLEPVIFEIGRTGPYQLSPVTSPVAQRVQQNTHRETFGTWLFYYGVVVAALVFFVACLCHYFRRVQDTVIQLGAAAKRFGFKVLRLTGLQGNNGSASEIETNPAGDSEHRAQQTKRVGSESVWLCIGLFATLPIYLVVLMDNGRTQGEPLSILAGISVWPSLLLLYGVSVCAAYLTLFWLRETTANAIQLQGDYSMSDSEQPIDDSLSPVKLFRDWIDTEKRKQRVTRVCWQTGAFCAFNWLLFYVTDTFPGIPFRGWISHVCAWTLTYAALIAFYFASFVVLDVIRNSSRFCVDIASGLEAIVATSEADANSTGKRRTLVSAYDLTRGQIGEACEISDEQRRELSEVYTIEFIARQTRLPGRMVIYPFLLALMLASTRLSFFDSWDIGLSLLAVISLILGGIALGGIVLRRSAQKARRRVLRRLHESLTRALAESEPQQVDRIKDAISRVENEQRGAFRPLSEDPVIAAIFIPFGGTGTLVLLERFLHHF